MAPEWPTTFLDASRMPKTRPAEGTFAEEAPANSIHARSEAQFAVASLSRALAEQNDGPFAGRSLGDRTGAERS